MGKLWNRALPIIESLDQIIGTIFSGRRDNGKQAGKRKTYLPESGLSHTATGYEGLCKAVKRMEFRQTAPSPDEMNDELLEE